MTTLCDVLQLLSSGAIGILVGALLAEGALFIPYWRSLPAETFYSLHTVYGPRLYRFFAPLTILPSVLTIAAAIVCLWAFDPGRWATLISSVLFLAVVGTYGVYFRNANARLAKQSLSPEELSDELRRWAVWHWTRVVLGLLAFGAALVGVNGGG